MVRRRLRRAIARLIAERKERLLAATSLVRLNGEPVPDRSMAADLVREHRCAAGREPLRPPLPHVTEHCTFAPPLRVRGQRCNTSRFGSDLVTRRFGPRERRASVTGSTGPRSLHCDSGNSASLCFHEGTHGADKEYRRERVRDAVTCTDGFLVGVLVGSET